MAAARNKALTISRHETLLRKAVPKIQQVLPGHLRAERMVRMALFAVSQDQKLLACRTTSILYGVMQAAALGLDVGGVNGHAFLVPFGAEAKLVTGYKGMIDLAVRSGFVVRVQARVVRASDDFSVELGTNEHIHHVPGNGVGDDISHAYALAWFKDSDRPAFEVLPKELIDSFRKRSKAGRSGPWKTDYDAMAMKTAVRRLATWLPQSPELSAALELDSRSEGRRSGYSDILDGVSEEQIIDATAEVVDPDEPKPPADLDDLEQKL